MSELSQFYSYCWWVLFHGLIGDFDITWRLNNCRTGPRPAAFQLLLFVAFVHSLIVLKDI